METDIVIANYMHDFSTKFILTNHVYDVDHFDHVDHVDYVDYVDSVDHVDHAEHVDQVDHLDHLDHLDVGDNVFLVDHVDHVEDSTWYPMDYQYLHTLVMICMFAEIQKI